MRDSVGEAELDLDLHGNGVGDGARVWGAGVEADALGLDGRGIGVRVEDAEERVSDGVWGLRLDSNGAPLGGAPLDFFIAMAHPHTVRH